MFKRIWPILLILLFLAGTAASFLRSRDPAHEGLLLKTEGYGGKILLDLVQAPDGRVNSLAILDHNETPSYIGDPSNFLSQFTGKGSASTLEIGKDIDGITGATVTCRAITQAVHATLKGTPVNISHPVKPRDIMMPLVLLALSLTALLRQSPALRWVAMAAGFTYFGLITRMMFSTVQAANIGLLHFPSFSVNALWWMILAVSCLPAFILGRIYCSSLCPFALIQECLRKIHQQSDKGAASSNTRVSTGSHEDLTIRRAAIKSAPAGLNPCARGRRGGFYVRPAHVKYLLLIVILSSGFILGNSAAADIEVFTTLFTARGPIIAWLALALVLIASFFHTHFWCRFLCPAGALLGICASFAPVKIRTNSGCDSCGACQKICPTDAISRSDQNITVNEAECILCGQCLTACSRNALSLRRKP